METITIVGGLAPQMHTPTGECVQPIQCDTTKDDIVCVLSSQVQLKMQHLAAANYNEHLILGNLYDALEPLVDEYCELLLAVKTRTVLAGNHPMTISVCTSPATILQQQVACLEKLPTDRRDVNAVVDQMIAAINRTIYLLTF